MLDRRSSLRGAGALLAAPAIVRVSSLMPVFAPKYVTFRMGATRIITFPRGDHPLFWACVGQETHADGTQVLHFEGRKVEPETSPLPALARRITFKVTPIASEQTLRLGDVRWRA